MLTICEECGLQVSDKAYSCPHCGNPMQDFQKVFPKIPPRKNSKKRLRLPNGFGRITKIKGRNRKPYRAMVTIGKDENGKPIGKLLKPQSYFETYNDAYQALLEYNKNPYDLINNLTFAEVYSRWFERHTKNLSLPAIRNITASYDYCHLIYNVEFRSIRIKHMKLCLEEGYVIRKGKRVEPTIARQKNMKTLFNMMFDYAIEFEITDRNYAREYNMKFGTKDVNHHITYTKEEMEVIWEHTDEQIARFILIQCYSGLRPGELLDLKKEKVFFDFNIMIGGKKTKAGINRTIPIHPLIKNITEVFLAEDLPLSYWTMYDRFVMFLEKYNLSKEHRPHDGRKHFITQAKKYNVDEYAIKRIVGHSIKSDLTESVYTERGDDWLYSEICKIEKY